MYSSTLESICTAACTTLWYMALSGMWGQLCTECEPTINLPTSRCLPAFKKPYTQLDMSSYTLLVHPPLPNFYSIYSRHGCLMHRAFAYEPGHRDYCPSVTGSPKVGVGNKQFQPQYRAFSQLHGSLCKF